MKNFWYWILGLVAFVLLTGGCSATYEFKKWEFKAPGFNHTIAAQEDLITCKMEVDPVEIGNTVVDGVSDVIGNIAGKFKGLFTLLTPTPAAVTPDGG